MESFLPGHPMNGRGCCAEASLAEQPSKGLEICEDDGTSPTQVCSKSGTRFRINGPRKVIGQARREKRTFVLLYGDFICKIFSFTSIVNERRHVDSVRPSAIITINPSA